MRHLLWIPLLSCSGGEGKDEEDPGPAPTADADADTDSDTDTDSETGTLSESGTVVDTGPLLTGPISPGLYLVLPTYVYALPDAPPPPPDSGSTGDTGTGQLDFRAAFVRFQAFFGYDGNGHVIETTINGGDPIPSEFTVFFGTAAWEATGWSTTDTVNSCNITFPLAGGSLAPWVAYTQRLWWGTEYLAGPLGGDCGTILSPVDVSAFGDPLVDWEGMVGIGGAVGGLLPEVEAQLVDDFDADMMRNVFGAQFRLDVLFGPNTTIDDAYALAYQIDLATYELVIDSYGDLVFIEADDVHPFP